MNILKITLLLVVALLLSTQAHARFETHDFATPQMERDYNVLVQELRCLVCQNQNLADSNAELAQDMRQQVALQLNSGSSKEQIVTYMVERYGDFVMYRPPFKSITLLLWLGPLVFFLIAAAVVVTFVRSQKKVAADLNEPQQDKAHSLLDDK